MNRGSDRQRFTGQVAANVKPSLVIFVMDGSIGQAAFDQAKAFKDAVEVCHMHVCCAVPHMKQRV